MQLTYRTEQYHLFPENRPKVNFPIIRPEFYRWFIREMLICWTPVKNQRKQESGIISPASFTGQASHALPINTVLIIIAPETGVKEHLLEFGS